MNSLPQKTTKFMPTFGWRARLALSAQGARLTSGSFWKNNLYQIISSDVPPASAQGGEAPVLRRLRDIAQEGSLPPSASLVPLDAGSHLPLVFQKGLNLAVNVWADEAQKQPPEDRAGPLHMILSPDESLTVENRSSGRYLLTCNGAKELPLPLDSREGVVRELLNRLQPPPAPAPAVPVDF